MISLRSVYSDLPLIWQPILHCLLDSGVDSVPVLCLNGKRERKKAFCGGGVALHELKSQNIILTTHSPLKSMLL